MSQFSLYKELLGWFIRRYPRQGKQSKGLISLYYFWVERISTRGKMLLGALFIFFLIELAPEIQVTAYWIIAIFIILIMDWFWPRSFPEINSLEWLGEEALFYGQTNKQILKVYFKTKTNIEIKAILSRIPEPFLPMKNGIAGKGNKTIEYEFFLEPRYRKSALLKTVTLQLPGPFGLINKIKKIHLDQTLHCFDKDLGIKNFYFKKIPLKPLDNDNSQNEQLSKSDSELVHLKEYQHGDPIKHIDHKAWARKGKPIVKVFEEFNTLDKKQSFSKEYHFSNFLKDKAQRLNWEQFISSFAKHIRQEINSAKPILIAYEADKKNIYQQNEILNYLSNLKPDFNQNIEVNKSIIPIEFNQKRLK